MQGSDRTRQVFTTGDVARICGAAPTTVNRWFDAGLIRGYRLPLSGDRRVTREELIRFLKANDMPLRDLGDEVP
jgi:two-component system, OmpR family, response regulator RpaA